MKKLSAISVQLLAISSRLTAYGYRLAAYASRPVACGSQLTILSLLLAACGTLLVGAAWAAGPEEAGSAATQQVTNVACGGIGLVQGVVGKMLAFVFLAAGAVAAFVGKWAYVAGGVGGGILLILGPQILKGAFIGGDCAP